MMRTGIISVWLAALVCAGCSEGQAPQAADAGLESMNKSDWTVLADRRVFFGHQSVGYNIVEGVADLMRGEQRPALRVAESAAPGDLQPGVLAHATVGQNGDPRSKIRAFAEYMDSGVAAHSDVALFKFCYIDVDAETDVDGIFSEYKRVMDDLARRHPDTRFVHATMPLRLVQTGPKAVVKRLLARPAGGYVENVRRNRYNALLRREYQGRAPIFDIAALESQSGGQPTTFTFQGEEFFSLNPAYTPDNGHLNESGRRVVAAGFLNALAEAARRGE
jgi:hypothetical protein